MPFIGKTPETGAYQLIDSITTSATATYALTVDGSAYFPASARNLIVSLNGVTQAPESAYTVSGSDIVFASALTASDVIDYILVIGDAVDIGTPSDGTVGTSQMSYPLGNFSSTGIDDNATSTAITIDSSQNVNLSNDLTVDTDTLVVDSTNNAVGINTVTASAPQSTFHIEQNGDDADGGFRLSRDNALASYTQYINGSSIWNLAYGNPSSDDSPTDILSVTTDGNVGIGDSTPDAGLTVHNNAGAVIATSNIGRQTYTGVGNLQVSTANSGGILIHTENTASSGFLGFGDGQVAGRIEYQHSVDNMTFMTGANTRMTLDASGSLIVPDIYNRALTNVRDCYVNVGGRLGYLSSTRESKANIEPLSDVSWLYDLNTVSFNYRTKDDETNAYTDEVIQETEYGLIADEVEQVNADLCFYDEDEEGNQTLAGVSYRKLIPVLTKAIQEQQTIIEDLQTRLYELEAN
jgi:hypothetical protein